MRLKNKDIAEMLGISTTAVSLAINDRPGVSEETRRKVFEILNQNARDNYTAVENGENFAKTGTILLSVHKKHGQIINDKPFFSDLVATVQQETVRQGYFFTLTNYLPGQDLTQYMNYIRELSVDGIIVMATELLREDLEHYRRLRIPMVLMDASFDLEEVDSVELDNQIAVYRSVEFAYQKGHREIGYLQSSLFIQNFLHHYDGYIKGLEKHGLLGHYHPVIKLPCSIDGAYREMKAFLEENPDFQMPTCFLADLDYIAMGAMKAMKEAGYRIPEDVSVIGYDDVAACEIFEPPLTTTRVNHMDIGRLSVSRLLQRLKENGDFYTTTQVSSRLIERESVRVINRNEPNHAI